MSKRIYIVTDTDFNIPRLVRANTPAQALTHVTKNRFVVKVATQDQIVDALNDDVTVETAGEVPAGDPPAGDPPVGDQPVGDQQPQPEAVPQAAAA